jgi:hypothetical protein
MLWKAGTGRLPRTATEDHDPAATDPTGVVPAVVVRIVAAAAIAGDRTARRLHAVSPLPSNHAANQHRSAMNPNRHAPQRRIVPGKTVPAGTARVVKRLPQTAIVARAKMWLRP